MSVKPNRRPVGPSGIRYEAITQIGRGGMAEVLLAMMEAGAGARRLVVLKRIWPELATDFEFVTMFMDEAKLSLRLNHANVVQTYEVLVDEHELSIAMEYLDGQPLTQILNRLRGPGELGLPLRLRIAASVLAGLEHAHTLTELDGSPLGVVHRDVSPQNVFVTYDGQVKLVDFGVAKTLAASHQTRPGAIKGKLAYMAPEQLQREIIDRRVDVFAAGVLLWEMLAGRRMWHGMTEVEIVAHLANAKPLPPLPGDRGLPAGLDAICARSLECDPDRRYQTAADMQLELERVLVGSADSHARNLGNVVSLAFTAERAERQTIIDRSLQRMAAPRVVLSLVSTPAPVLLPAAPLAPTPSTPSTPSATASGAIDIPLDDLPGPDPQPPLRSGRLWARRIAADVGLTGAAAAIVLAGGGRHLPAGEVRMQSGLGASVLGPAGEPRAVTPPPSSPAVRSRPPSIARHHRRPATAPIDEDATLPLTEESSNSEP